MNKGRIVEVEIDNKTYKGVIVDFLTKEQTKALNMFGQLIKVYIYELDKIDEFTYGYVLTEENDENFVQY